ncbi:hypothetical protein Vi05172_g7645 [Venturia inaequalis]|nr:hypothetical protein Vi05172_g7645 [Venturia inaequalis]
MILYIYKIFSEGCSDISTVSFDADVGCIQILTLFLRRVWEMRKLWSERRSSELGNGTAWIWATEGNALDCASGLAKNAFRPLLLRAGPESDGGR